MIDRSKTRDIPIDPMAVNVVALLRTRVAETILASGPNRPHQQAGHMDASDPIRHLKNFLRHGARPHMDPGLRRDDDGECGAHPTLTPPIKSGRKRRAKSSAP